MWTTHETDDNVAGAVKNTQPNIKRKTWHFMLSEVLCQDKCLN